MGTSIVILTFNKIEYTKKCINSIRKYTDKQEYELILVDNNSTDETREWLSKQEDIKIVLNDKNEGFPKGCNIGIEASKKENDILLLNNDTIVTNDWLSNLRKCLYSDEWIGAVGPITNSSAYYQQMDVDYNDMDNMQKFALKYNISNEKLWEERQKLIGFCMLIKRQALEAVGLLDEVFTPGNFEDDDYSIRLIDKGYKLMLCKDTFIHHYGGVSFSKNKEYSELIKQNEKAFKIKWGFTSIEDMNIYKSYLKFINGRKPKILEAFCGTGATALYITQNCNCEYFGYEYNKCALLYSRGTMKLINYTNELKAYNNFDYLIISNVEKFFKDSEFQQEVTNNIGVETKVIINLKESQNNESTINKILSYLGTEKYKLTDGINEVNLINQDLNRTFIVLTDKRYYQVIKRLNSINLGNDLGNDFEILIKLVVEDNTILPSIINGIKLYSTEISEVLNTFGVLLFKNNVINCGKVFKAAYDYNNQDHTTLMNNSELFYEIEQYDLALIYIDKVQNKDEQWEILHNKIIDKISVEKKIKFILRRIEFDLDSEKSINVILDLLIGKEIDENIILRCVQMYIINKSKVLNLIAVKAFEKEVYDIILPLLNEAYKINCTDIDTNYNLAYVLSEFGEHEIALNYLEQLSTKNEEIEELICRIKGDIVNG